MFPQLTPDDVQRFWSKVTNYGIAPAHRPELGPCWVWTDRPGNNGYGRLNICYTAINSHRLSWVIHFGTIPDGLWVLHHCDNRLCVKPTHLFLGTAADNNEDMRAKGREGSGERHGSRTHPESRPHGDAHWSRRMPERRARGESRKNAKLTPDLVRAIRETRAGGMPWLKLAATFGVSQGCVRSAASGKTWSHVS